MTQDNASGKSKGITFAHAVAARLPNRLAMLGLLEDKDTAKEFAAKFQRYHDAKPDLGNIGENGMEEGFRRRAALAEWERGHPAGEKHAQLVQGFEVVSLPWLYPENLPNLANFP
ncbi:hypothetical protein BJP27_24195 (plasmid) [Pseudomonas oryzihabitans]|nr:hypothetical protein BJP27_24195 [Pseudomonas psychrotolerans]